MPAILERKPASRFVLVRLDCGCETWMTPDRVGRRVTSCGEGAIHDVSKAGAPIGHFLQQAQQLLTTEPSP